jgi:hypothetical protein
MVSYVYMQMGHSPVDVSSELWVQAVTNEDITKGMAWSIGISSLFAMVAVYVFTGSLIVMLLATITMAGINVLVLGMPQPPRPLFVQPSSLNQTLIVSCQLLLFCPFRAAVSSTQ